MANGLITLSGTGSELLQRPEIRAAYLEGGRRVGVSCGTTPLLVVPVHAGNPYRAMLRFCAGPRYLSLCCGRLWAPAFAGARQHAAKVSRICPKFADDFAAKSADNGLGFGTRRAGCFP
jgi:hypothetical protein